MLKSFIFFLRDLYLNRALILQLTRREFKSRYLGSYLGLLWAFIQPLVTILILWFVFEVGFKSVPVLNFPFILWLLAGIVPWFFFAESLSSATYSVVENTFLVKKVVFRVSILPIVKICTALIIHLFFVAVILVFFLAYGINPTIYSLQFIYYLFAAMVLLTGLSWATSAMMVFLKDVGQMVALLLQVGFWGTPIFWSMNLIPPEYHFIIKLNPVFYITEGYRDSFINHVWFWEHASYSLYFWLVTGALFVIGGVIFSRLRPHFADVL